MSKGSYSWKYHCWKTIVFYTAIIIALNIICLWIYSIFICHITAAISHIQIFIWSSFWRFGLIRSQMFPQRHLFLTVRAFHQTKTNLWVHPFSILGVLKALCAFKRGYRLVTTQSHCQWPIISALLYWLLILVSSSKCCLNIFSCEAWSNMKENNIWMKIIKKLSIWAYFTSSCVQVFDLTNPRDLI